MLLLAQVVVSGLTIGSVYALLALALASIYRATGMVNFAQGEMMMIGAMTALTAHRTFHLSFIPTLLIAVLCTWILGVIIERVSRPLLSAQAFTIVLSTAAVGQIIRSGVRVVKGDELATLPPILSTTPFTIAGVSFTPLSIGIVVISLVCLGVFVAFFRWTKLGWAMWATSQNREAAALVGVSVPRVFSMSWGIAGALAAVAGVLIAPLIYITPDMGAIGVKGFMAAIIGGYNSLAGAVLGGFCLGLLESLSGVYISSTFKDVVTLAFLVLMVTVRPWGLLGKPETRRV
jgi:branched-chain amino acid transport system permease protein